MKKRKFLAIVLSIFATVAFGKENIGTTLRPDKLPIDLEEILIPPKPGPKSIVKPILASYDNDLCMVSLSIDTPQGLMAVSVEDEFGNLILQQAVDGNQSSIDILLPTLTAGYYKLTIKSCAHLLVGWFEVY